MLLLPMDVIKRVLFPVGIMSVLLHPVVLIRVLLVFKVVQENCYYS